MNRSSAPAEPVCGNWNSTSPSFMSFVGLESSAQKQFWDWDTNTDTTNSHNNNNTSNNHHPFIIPTTSFIDFSSSSSSYSSAPTTFPTPCYPQITDNPATATGFLKREDGCFGMEVAGNYSNGRIGLNLGHRTYFASQETAMIGRLFKRSRGFYQANQIPRCQAEGCKVDLTNAKHYHRRHRVCEFHSKATKVVLAGGLEQRFCQQCSRFHVLAEFDEVKRSCRKRLADHNRRRRKTQSGTTTSDSVAGRTAQNGIEESKETGKETRASFPLLMIKDNKSSNREELQHQFEQKLVVTQLQKGPALSLGGFQRCSESQITYTHQPLSSTSSFHARESVSPSLCMIDRHFCHNNLLNEASQSNGGGSIQNQHQQPEELHNLLQLGHAMFEVELL